MHLKCSKVVLDFAFSGELCQETLEMSQLQQQPSSLESTPFSNSADAVVLLSFRWTNRFFPVAYLCQEGIPRSSWQMHLFVDIHAGAEEECHLSFHIVLEQQKMNVIVSEWTVLTSDYNTSLLICKEN